jgi:predicted acyltransferase
MESTTTIQKERLFSLDLFRGLTVAGMILVNNQTGEKVYEQLGHSQWNGCTITDMIFPFFLYIIGVSIYFSISTKKGNDHKQIILDALVRSIKIIGLSLFLFLFPKVFIAPIDAFETVRIQGILFRIALVYFICTVLFLKMELSNIAKLGIAFLVLYWLLLMLIPVPGVGYSNLDMETNLVAWLDRLVITPAHLLHKTWDPQGLLGTIPACATTIMGIITGYLLKTKKFNNGEKVAWVFTFGTVSVLAGLVWSINFPLNKALWSSSFVLYTGGIASILMALCYWTVDVNVYRFGTKPFVAFGKNAIVIYFLSELLPRVMNLIKFEYNGNGYTSRSFITRELITPLFSSPYSISVANGVFYVLIFMALAWWMYKKNIFIKV